MSQTARLAVYERLSILLDSSLTTPSLIPIAKVHKNSKKMHSGLNF